MNNTITKMKTIIKKFISDKKGADDKNAGSAVLAMVKFGVY